MVQVFIFLGKKISAIWAKQWLTTFLSKFFYNSFIMPKQHFW